MADEYIFRLYSENEDGDRVDQVDLTDGDCFSLGESAVSAPPPRQKVSQGADSMYRHGADVVRARYENSLVRVRNLTIVGGTTEGLADNIVRLMRILEKARLRQERGWGERVYVERDLRAHSDRDPLRKEVYRGELGTPREDLSQLIKSKRVMSGCTLDLTCYPFWQGLETEIVSSTSTDNHYCGVYPPAPQNWVDVDAVDVPGDAPCLLKITLSPQDIGVYIRTIRVGIKRRGTPQTFVGTYQAEDVDVILGPVSDVTGNVISPDLSCDDGLRITPSTVNNTFQFYWTARVGGGVLLEDLDQGTYRVLLRIRNNDNARIVKAQFRLGNSAGNNDTWYFTGDQQTVVTHTTARFVIADLGIIEIPPVPMGSVIADSYQLEVWTQSDAASGTIDVDYLMLLPIEGGSKLSQAREISTGGAATNTTFLRGDDLIYNGFEKPPISTIINTTRLKDILTDDLGFLAYIEPQSNHRIFFSLDEWHTTEHKAWNNIDTLFDVTVDIMPQYFYLR